MLLALNPTTNATAERSFSLARGIKIWNRSTMMPKRFNSLSILNFHKTETENLDVLAVANEFVSKFDDGKKHLVYLLRRILMLNDCDNFLSNFL